MTRHEVKTLLRGFIRDFAIDPHDGGEIFDLVPDEGIDAETLGDCLDGQGYPELAERVYEEHVS